MPDDSHTHNGEHPLVIRTVPSPYSEPPMIDFIEFEVSGFMISTIVYSVKNKTAGMGSYAQRQPSARHS